MKKLLICLSLLFAMSCFSGPQLPYHNSMGDESAEYAQSLMRNAVKIEETVTVKATPKGEGEPEEFKLVTSGSGVIISNDKKEDTSVILTAWHVCDRYPVGFSVETYFDTLEVVADKQEVISVGNKRIKILDYLYKDKDSDICVVKADHAFMYHAELATEMPPRGAIVSVVGAPLGEWGKFLVSMSDGRYFGQTDIDVILGITDEEPTKLLNFAYYGFAGVGGYSGSGIYYRGKLIGLHTAGANRYEHANYGPALEEITWAVEYAK